MHSQYPNAVTGTAPNQIPENWMLGTGAYQDFRFIDVSFSWTPGAVATSAQASTSVTVPGAAYGDFVMVSCASITAGMFLTALVDSADTVRVLVHNLSGGSITPPSTTYYVRVMKRIP